MNIKAMFYLMLTAIIFGCSDSSSTNPNESVGPRDFLSGQKFTSLTIEVVYVNGYQPSSATMSNMNAFLQGVANKPSGVTGLQRGIASQGKTTFSLDDLKQIEAANRIEKTSGSTLTAWIFFADGEYAGNSGNSKVLGIAYGPSSMAIFEKTVKDFSGGVGKPSTDVLETTVVNHELGHILGLTNNGTAMQAPHQDTANGKHCTTQNCLMYFNVETSDVISNLLGGNVPQLNAACSADLKANGGK